MRFVLVAIADAANPDGEHAQPGMFNIVESSLYSERHAQRIIARLIDEGWLEQTISPAPGREAEYRLPGVYRDWSARHSGRRSKATPAKRLPNACQTQDTQVAGVSGVHTDLLPTTDTRTGTDLPASPRKRTPRDDIFDALVESCHLEPTEVNPARISALVTELLSLNATPDEVHVRAANYVRRWDVSLTPAALVKHWASMRTDLVDAELSRRRSKSDIEMEKIYEMGDAVRAMQRPRQPGRALIALDVAP